MTEIKAELYLQNNLCRFLLQVDANLHVPVKKINPASREVAADKLSSNISCSKLGYSVYILKIS